MKREVFITIKEVLSFLSKIDKSYDIEASNIIDSGGELSLEHRSRGYLTLEDKRDLFLLYTNKDEWIRIVSPNISYEIVEGGEYSASIYVSSRFRYIIVIGENLQYTLPSINAKEIPPL